MIVAMVLSALLPALVTPPADDLDDPAELARALRQHRRGGEARAALDLLDERGAALLSDERVLGEAVQACLDIGDVERARQLVARALPGPRARALPLAVGLTGLLLAGGDASGARENLAALLASRPEHPDLRLLALRLALLEGDVERATRELDALAHTLPAALTVELRADLALAHGVELMALDELLERAIDVLEPAQRAAPHRADLRALLARALARWQRVDRAEALLDEGLAQASDADRVPLLFARGLVLRNALREEEAQRCLDEVLAREPEHVRARVALAGCHLERGDLDGAGAQLGRVLRTAPEDLEALLLLSDLESARGDWEAAAAALERVLEVKPRHLKGLWMLSRVRARQHRVADVAALVDRYEQRVDVLAARR